MLFSITAHNESGLSESSHRRIANLHLCNDCASLIAAGVKIYQDAKIL